MSDPISDKDLQHLYRQRLKDRKQSRTKRRIRTEARPKTLAEILPDYFEESPSTMQRIEETRALIAWENYVGSAASLHSKAIRLRANTLTVQVRDPLWMQQLSLLKYEILKHYRKDFPKLKIQNIFFVRQNWA